MRLRREKSRMLHERAGRVLAGGVNSPVRSFSYVGMEPIALSRGEGPYVHDLDGNRYIDLICGWGALILGHARREVLGAVEEALARGSLLGLTSEPEVELGELITRALPSIERVRLVNTGTEAAMTAIRLARAYTGRRRVVKFEGCYHGHVDYLLTKAGSGLATHSLPASEGVHEELTRDVITIPFNSIEGLERVFRESGGEIACVIAEPIAGNMGVVPPRDGFLESLREVTERHGSLLILDEVITGFRVAWGGAQSLYHVVPDLTCLGKIIGGGLPIGAVGGREDVMEKLAPSGKTYQAGTFSGNPVSAAAGAATLRLLGEEAYSRLEASSSRLASGLREAAEEVGVSVVLNRVGSMMSLFFTEGEVWDYASASRSDRELFKRLFWEMAERGVLLPPSPFESLFISTSHDEGVIERIIAAFTESIRGACAAR